MTETAPLVIPLGERMNRRLSVLQAAAHGARAAEAAVRQAAEAAEARYREALATVLEAHGVAVTDATLADYQPDNGRVLVAERAAGDAATTAVA